MTLTTFSSPNVLLVEATFDKSLALLRISNSYSGSYSTTVHIKHNFQGVLIITRLGRVGDNVSSLPDDTVSMYEAA
jgi:hypothetical protein